MTHPGPRGETAALPTLEVLQRLAEQDGVGKELWAHIMKMRRSLASRPAAPDSEKATRPTLHDLIVALPRWREFIEGPCDGDSCDCMPVMEHDATGEYLRRGEVLDVLRAARSEAGPNDR